MIPIRREGSRRATRDCPPWWRAHAQCSSADDLIPHDTLTRDLNMAGDLDLGLGLLACDDLRSPDDVLVACAAREDTFDRRTVLYIHAHLALLPEHGRPSGCRIET